MRGSIKGQRHSSWNICWVVDRPQGQGGIRDSSRSETNTPFFCVFARANCHFILEWRNEFGMLFRRLISAVISVMRSRCVRMSHMSSHVTCHVLYW